MHVSGLDKLRPAKAHVQPSSVLWVVSVEGNDGDIHPAGVMSTGVIHRILCAAGTSWRDALPHGGMLFPAFCPSPTLLPTPPQG